jgi:hypothetical protein
VASTAYLFPWLRASKSVTQNLSLFAELKQDATAGTYDDAANRNPFFAPLLPIRDTLVTRMLHSDIRRTEVTRYQATLGADYFLSSRDRLHFEVSFGSKRCAAEFGAIPDSGGRTSYFVTPTDVHFASFDADIALQFFRNDLFDLSFKYASTRAVANDEQLPYEPILIANARYTFGSVWQRLRPWVGLNVRSRSEANLVYVDVGSSYDLGPNSSLGLVCRNVLGNDGAYWTGHQEHNRAVNLSLSVRF